jgi:integrase
MATRRDVRPVTEKHRRPRGTGTIRQRGTTFTACWFTIDPASGKREQQSKGGFSSMDAAQAHLTAALADVRRGTFHRDQRVTVKELFEDHWLPVKASEGKRPNTVAYYTSASKWVTDRIGGLRLESLTERDVARMVATMKAEGLSPRSRQAAVGALKAATAWAARPTVKLVGIDPLAHYHRPGLNDGGTPAGIKAWSVDQVRTFLAAAAADRFAFAWALLLTRGLRRGEMCGLRWSDIDFANRAVLHVNRTRLVVDGSVSDSDPKTSAGRRSIPLDDRLVTLLQAHKSHQTAEMEAASPAYADVGYLLADELGRPIHPDTLSRRFDALVTKSQLPRLTIHGLRHTAATLMLSDGVPTKIVSEMLGHSSPVITLAIYAHVLPGMAEDAGAALSKSLLG